MLVTGSYHSIYQPILSANVPSGGHLAARSTDFLVTASSLLSDDEVIALAHDGALFGSPSRRVPIEKQSGTKEHKNE